MLFIPIVIIDSLSHLFLSLYFQVVVHEVGIYFETSFTSFHPIWFLMTQQCLYVKI